MSTEGDSPNHSSQDLGDYMRSFIKSNREDQSTPFAKNQSETDLAQEYQETSDHQKTVRHAGRPKGSKDKSKRCRTTRNTTKTKSDDSTGSMGQVNQGYQTLKKKRGRPSKKYLKELLQRQKLSKDKIKVEGTEEKEEGMESEQTFVDQRKRGRPEKSEGVEMTAAKPKTIGKLGRIAFDSKRKLMMRRIRNSLQQEGQIQNEDVPDKFKTRETKEQSKFGKKMGHKLIVERQPCPEFEILQIKRSEGGLLYLVQVGEHIRWACKAELIDHFPRQMIDFFENRLMGSKDEKNNIYVRYE